MQERLEENISDELKKLTPTHRTEFFKILVDVLNDRAWCLANAIPYCNLDVRRAGSALLRELKEFEYFT